MTRTRLSELAKRARQLNDSRDAPYSLDLAAFYKVQGLELLNRRTQKLHFATTQGRATTFLDLSTAVMNV